MTPLAIAKAIALYGPEVIGLYERLANDLKTRPTKEYTPEEIAELARLFKNTGRSVLDEAGLAKAVAALGDQPQKP